MKYFTGVLHNQIDSIWSNVAELIQQAIDVENEHTLDEVYGSLIRRERQLWIAGNSTIEAILITQIQNETCYVELCAGKGVSCTKFLKIVEAWARQGGCKKINILGRKGWERTLKKDGYKFKSVTLSKELQNGDADQK